MCTKFKRVRHFSDKFPNWKIYREHLFVPNPCINPLIGDRDALKLIVSEELSGLIVKGAHNSPTAEKGPGTYLKKSLCCLEYNYSEFFL